MAALSFSLGSNNHISTIVQHSKYFKPAEYDTGICIYLQGKQYMVEAEMLHSLVGDMISTVGSYATHSPDYQLLIDWYRRNTNRCHQRDFYTTYSIAIRECTREVRSTETEILPLSPTERRAVSIGGLIIFAEDNCIGFNECGIVFVEMALRCVFDALSGGSQTHACNRATELIAKSYEHYSGVTDRELLKSERMAYFALRRIFSKELDPLKWRCISTAKHVFANTDTHTVDDAISTVQEFHASETFVEYIQNIAQLPDIDDESEIRCVFVHNVPWFATHATLSTLIWDGLPYKVMRTNNCGARAIVIAHESTLNVWRVRGLILSGLGNIDPEIYKDMINYLLQEEHQELQRLVLCRLYDVITDTSQRGCYHRDGMCGTDLGKEHYSNFFALTHIFVKCRDVATAIISTICIEWSREMDPEVAQWLLDNWPYPCNNDGHTVLESIVDSPHVLNADELVKLYALGTGSIAPIKWKERLITSLYIDQRYKRIQLTDSGFSSFLDLNYDFNCYDSTLKCLYTILRSVSRRGHVRDKYAVFFPYNYDHSQRYVSLKRPEFIDNCYMYQQFPPSVLDRIPSDLEAMSSGPIVFNTNNVELKAAMSEFSVDQWDTPISRLTPVQTPHGAHHSPLYFTQTQPKIHE